MAAKDRIGTVASKQSRADPEGPLLLPISRAAEKIGLTKWGLRERIWAGDIPIVQFPGGRKMYVDVRDLEDFIERNKRRVR